MLHMRNRAWTSHLNSPSREPHLGSCPARNAKTEELKGSNENNSAPVENTA